MNLSASEECEKGTEIRYPFESACHVDILGSSNGLLCILVGDQYFDENIICIWNPTTKEYKRVPKSPNNQFPCDLIIDKHRVTYGFCYDCKIGDFKLIKAVGFVGVTSRCGVQLYNLGSNSWNNTYQFIPYCFQWYIRRSSITVHGSLHWLARPGVENMQMQRIPDVIVSFGICEDRFQDLALPAAVENEGVVKKQLLGALDGCLCLFLQQPGRRVDMWVMREYGVKESWSILYTTNNQLLVHYPFRINSLVHSFENGEILLANYDHSFILYNPRHDKAKKVTIPGIYGSCIAESYVTSLFSLNSRTYVGQDDRIQDLA
ncbi:F-box protein CPR1-like [Papaver somniferum]|uniref:F-box protein CPR1-like n=1 Tax=Papaver somniferum TaxID=3469 RepID=UPI000E6F8AFC|nr:F-box protein CPR1-like [Papaver somniferum]